MFFKNKESSSGKPGFHVAHKLPDALRIAIDALEQDTFPYKWNDQGSCNCGIVISAIGDTWNEKTRDLFDDAWAEAGLQGKGEKDGLYTTWREVAQHSCSVTGQPITSIMRKLAEAGFTPKDMVHLEYMTNSAVLKESGIDNSTDHFYADRRNLVNYLKAWLRIIEKSSGRANFTQKQELEADLLIATATENYEEAGLLSRKLASL